MEIHKLKDLIGYRIYNALCMSCVYYKGKPTTTKEFLKGECHLFKESTGGIFNVDAFGGCSKHKDR